VHLDDARGSLKRLYTALHLVPAAVPATIDWAQPYAARFKAAMDNDFATPEALAVLFDLAAEVNRTRSARPRACSRPWARRWASCRAIPSASCRPARRRSTKRRSRT
jgi:cysteinyl-tRNA synthetase